MNNPECFYRLQFPIDNWLNPNLDLSWYPDTFPDYEWGEKRIWGLQYPKIDTILSREAVDFFRSIGFESNMAGPDTVNLFRGNPASTMGIHHDMGPKFSINYSWGSSHSEMAWYRFKTANPRTYSKPSTTGRPTDYFYPEDLELIDSAEIDTPTLVRTHIPHHVINHDTKNYRWCVTLRNLSNKWTWEQAVDFFAPWIVEEYATPF